MPVLRRRLGVTRAVAKKAAANRQLAEEFNSLNPSRAGRREEAREKEWSSLPPSRKTIKKAIAAKAAYERAMAKRRRYGPQRLAQNPGAAERLKRMKAAKK
jgi:hypothetical protein